jgi:hypothetical protein
MTSKIEELESLMARLTAERGELEAAIEAMIGEMADVPAEQRKSGDWASDGAATRRYLERSSRLAEVEQAIVDLSRQLAAAGKP